MWRAPPVPIAGGRVMGEREHAMFLESLVESCKQREPRRGWATLLSFSLQTACIGLLVLLPLLYTGALPPLMLSEPVMAPPAAPPAHPRVSERTVDLVRPPSELTETGGIRLPLRIPTTIYMPKGREQAPAPVSWGGDDLGVPGSTGTEVANNSVLRDLLRATGNTVPERAVPVSRLTVSEGVQGALLIRRIVPPYPPLARQAGVQGSVLMRAVISREGTIESLTVLSGHPLLIKAAMDAVKQWRYRPTYLNRQPIEVETEITVNFVLGRG